MKAYWLIVLVLIAGCAPAKTGYREPPGSQNAILTARPVATLTQVQPTPAKKLTTPPVPPTPMTQAVSLEWLALASALRSKVQSAKTGYQWENVKFKEEAYQICDDLINASSGRTLMDSREILKRFRWGIEFMNQGELDEVIRIIDQYN